MTKTERTTLAKQIAKAEKIIQNSNNPEEVIKAQNKILELSQQSNMTLEDMITIDDLVQKFYFDF